MKDKWYFGNYIVCTMVWFISYWCDSCHVQHKESAWTTLTLNDSFFPHAEHKYAIQSVIEHMKWFIDIILEPWFVFLALPAWEWCVCVVSDWHDLSIWESDNWKWFRHSWSNQTLFVLITPSHNKVQINWFLLSNCQLTCVYKFAYDAPKALSNKASIVCRINNT